MKQDVISNNVSHQINLERKIPRISKSENESKTKKIDKKWLKTNEIFVPEIVPKIRNKNWSHLKTTNNILLVERFA